MAAFAGGMVPMLAFVIQHHLHRAMAVLGPIAILWLGWNQRSA